MSNFVAYSCLINLKILSMLSLANASETGLSSSYSSHGSGVSMPVTISITSSSVGILQVNNYLFQGIHLLTSVLQLEDSQ